MPTFYLVDFENSNSINSLDLSQTTEVDTVHLFYTENAKKIDLDVLIGMKAHLIVHKVPSGKQSLDMHLISFLGYLIGQYGNQATYVICSKDNDFCGPIDFWKKELGVEVELRVLEKSVVEEKVCTEIIQPKTVSDKTNFNNRIIQELAANDIDTVTAGSVASIVMKQYGKGNFKQLVYRSMIQSFGQKKGLELYRIVKNLL